MKKSYLYVCIIPLELKHNNLKKIGITTNLYGRLATYRTSSYLEPYYEVVYEIDYNFSRVIESNICKHMSERGLYAQTIGGGTEFFKADCVKEIPNCFNKMGMNCDALSHIEIKKLLHEHRSTHKSKQKNMPINFTKDELEKYHRLSYLYKNDKQKDLPIYKPTNIQMDVIYTSLNYFKTNSKGIISLPCGVGKTIISLFIAKYLQCRRILVGVYSNSTIKQWKDRCNSIFGDLKVYDHTENIPENINEHIVVINYKSSSKFVNNDKYDIKIIDECHHVTNIDSEEKTFMDILQIKSDYQLALSATLKTSDKVNDKVVSNYNIDYYGDIIYQKNITWAIENKLVCDFIIHIENPDDEYKKIEDKFINKYDKNLLFSAYVCLKYLQMNVCNHMLVYVNKNKRGNMLSQILGDLGNKNIYCANYDSSYGEETKTKILENFNNSKKGLLCTVYALGEGFDSEILDGVVICDKMTKEIRIVQSLLRPCRKNKSDENKTGKIIIPEYPEHKKSENLIRVMKKLSEGSPKFTEKVCRNHSVSSDKKNNDKHKNIENISQPNNACIIRTIEKQELSRVNVKLNIVGKSVTIDKETYFDQLQLFDDKKLNELLLDSIINTSFKSIAKVLFYETKSFVRYSNKKWYSFSGNIWHEGKLYVCNYLTHQIYKKYAKIMQFYESNEMLEKVKNAKNVLLCIEMSKTNEKIIHEAKTLFESIGNNFEQSLNSKSHLIGFNNGVFDLKEFKFRKALPEDLLTFTVGYNYDPNPTDRINNLYKFLVSIQPKLEDRENMLYSIARCLDSNNSDKLFTLLLGDDINCTNYLKKLLRTTFGNYFGNINGEFLTKRKFVTRDATTIIDHLVGKKIIISNNFDKNMELTEESIKNLVNNNSTRFNLMVICDKFTTFDVSSTTLNQAKCIRFPNVIDNNIRGIDEWGMDFMLLLLEYHKKLRYFSLTNGIIHDSSRTNNDHNLYKQHFAAY